MNSVRPPRPLCRISTATPLNPNRSRLLFRARQSDDGRAVERVAVAPVEARAAVGAVPGLLLVVPVNDAAETVAGHVLRDLLPASLFEEF